MHSYTHAPIHPCTHAPMHSYTHAPMHPCTHAPMHSYTHTLIRPYTHTPLHPHGTCVKKRTVVCMGASWCAYSIAVINQCTYSIAVINQCTYSIALISTCVKKRTHAHIHPYAHTPLHPYTVPASRSEQWRPAHVGVCAYLDACLDARLQPHCPPCHCCCRRRSCCCCCYRWVQQRQQ
jgi:hypothetical protein